MRDGLEALKQKLTDRIENDTVRRESASYRQMIGLAREAAKEARLTTQPIEVEGFTLYGCKVYLKR